MHLFGSHDDLPLGGYSRGLGAVPVSRPATGKTFTLSTFESFDESDITWFLMCSPSLPSPPYPFVLRLETLRGPWNEWASGLEEIFDR